MKNTEAVRKNTEFKKLYNVGKSAANRNLIIYYKENNENINRLGISVSKKVGNSPIRHRVKRLIKESYRLHEDEIMIGFDIIIIARQSMNGLSYKDTESSLIHLLKLVKLYKNGD
ncbi:MAG: ribonuclease P protein component [Clostridia bacterium]|jgi:ribonuclease P protein component|nr:ribonuclease P protein component [Clostridia bacterium]